MKSLSLRRSEISFWHILLDTYSMLYSFRAVYVVSVPLGKGIRNFGTLLIETSYAKIVQGFKRS